ncbi:MAG TPA: hypothetical protein VN445_14390 [Rectinemataceae bacterium]|nr:hypothetical protein [Rectinemataceae bacterium]
MLPIRNDGVPGSRSVSYWHPKREGVIRTIVIYTSASGFTKKYAEWIAQDLGADLVACAEGKA